jgi:hypothetical protein
LLGLQAADGLAVLLEGGEEGTVRRFGGFEIVVDALELLCARS